MYIYTHILRPGFIGAQKNWMLYHCVLQCVAECCSVLQRDAACCNGQTWIHRSPESWMLHHCVLQCVVLCCSVLQYVAVGCSVFGARTVRFFGQIGYLV